MTEVELAKLDDALSVLLATAHIAESQKIPVAIQASVGQLESVVSAVGHHGGTVRHVLRPLNAVAAWIPIGAVAIVAALEFVDEIEMDRVMHVA